MSVRDLRHCPFGGAPCFNETTTFPDQGAPRFQDQRGLSGSSCAVLAAPAPVLAANFAEVSTLLSEVPRSWALLENLFVFSDAVLAAPGPGPGWLSRPRRTPGCVTAAQQGALGYLEEQARQFVGQPGVVPDQDWTEKFINEDRGAPRLLTTLGSAEAPAARSRPVRKIRRRCGDPGCSPSAVPGAR